MYFIDSSAFVAVVAPEEDGAAYAERIDSSYEKATSPIVIYETVLAIARRRSIPVADALMLVLEYLQRADIDLMPISPDAHIMALGAHERYGKGTGHPAQLNLGDCFSYALAKQAGGRLLYKGDDFAQTDLA